ncbi:hypothetical protein ABK040_016522 [Willaertia magna]
MAFDVPFNNQVETVRFDTELTTDKGKCSFRDVTLGSTLSGEPFIFVVGYLTGNNMTLKQDTKTLILKNLFTYNPKYGYISQIFTLNVSMSGNITAKAHDIFGEPFSLIANQNTNEYYLAGFIYGTFSDGTSYFYGRIDGIIRKLSHDQQLVWEIRFGSYENQIVVKNMFLDRRGELHVNGFYKDKFTYNNTVFKVLENSQYNTFIMRLDSNNGNLLWSTYFTNSTQDIQITNIVEDAVGNLILGSSISSSFTTEEGKTIAARRNDDNSLLEDYNSNKQPFKKGLFIYSSKEVHYTEIDYLQNKLISFVVEKKEDEDGFNILSQLDRMDSELLDEYENILNDDYDILFISQLVSLSEKLLLQLKNLIELQRVAIVFFNATECKLAYQLNLLKESKNCENYCGQPLQFNLKNLSQLTAHSLTLQNFKIKHYNILNNFEQNSNEWTDINLNDKFLHFFNPENITNIEVWYTMLKFNENYALQQIQILTLTRRIQYKLEEIVKKEKKTIEEIIQLYGVEAEFYNPNLTTVLKKYPNPLDWQFEFFNDSSFCSSDSYDYLFSNYNSPPLCQPSLWCQWCYNKEENALEWDGIEKFYYYVDWIVYIINVILKPEDFIVNGKVNYIGEDTNDFGVIIVKDNVVYDIKQKTANEIDINNTTINFEEKYKEQIVNYKEMDYNNTINFENDYHAMIIRFNPFSKQNESESYQEKCKTYFKIKKEMDLRELKKKKRVENFRENLKRVKLSNDLDFKINNN